MNSSDYAYARQDLLLDLTDARCPVDNSIPNTVEALNKAISECDEAISDWQMLVEMSYGNEEELRLNRQGMQRQKTEKKYLKQRLKELLSSNKNGSEEVYS